MLGFVALQTGCDLQLTVGFFLASYANKRQAEIVMSFAQRIVTGYRALQQIDRVRVTLLFESYSPQGRQSSGMFRVTG
jgi:hypothetical protein